MRGSATIRMAAQTPATATTPSATRTHRVALDVTAAIAAKGLSAAASRSPSRKSVRTRVPTRGRGPAKRRTTAIRTTSSKRPGRAAPATEAAPRPAASVSGSGRSRCRKSRCQPNAFSGYATRKREAATATRPRSAWPSGQPIEAKCLATRANVPTAATPNPTVTTTRPRGERHAARNARMTVSHGLIVPSTITATGSVGRTPARGKQARPARHGRSRDRACGQLRIPDRVCGDLPGDAGSGTARSPVATSKERPRATPMRP